MTTLRESGVDIKATSFDAIQIPPGCAVDFDDAHSIRAVLPYLIFIEIKTASQARVGHDFAGFFFALTEAEVAASEVLGPRHRVALFNKRNGSTLETSVAEIMNRAKSLNWQVSVQL